MDHEQDAALFERSKAAVSFAVNHTRSLYAQPLMNKAANALAAAQQGKTGKVSREELRGLDGAGQAGLIWLHIDALPPFQKDSVLARVAPPTFPCNCRSACCMGVRPNPEWVDAIKRLSDYVRNEMARQQEKSRKKITINPQLRRMLIEKHFGRKYVNADLAGQFDLSENTIITYSKHIRDILTAWERSAFTTLDCQLSAIGVVGSTK